MPRRRNTRPYRFSHIYILSCLKILATPLGIIIFGFFCAIHKLFADQNKKCLNVIPEALMIQSLETCHVRYVVGSNFFVGFVQVALPILNGQTVAEHLAEATRSKYGDDARFVCQTTNHILTENEKRPQGEP